MVSQKAWQTFNSNHADLLDPSVSDPIIAGEVVENPGELKFTGPSDEEILIQFVEALESEPGAIEVLGAVERAYGYGLSRTAAFLLETPPGHYRDLKRRHL